MRNFMFLNETTMLLFWRMVYIRSRKLVIQVPETGSASLSTIHKTKR